MAAHFVTYMILIHNLYFVGVNVCIMMMYSAIT